VGSGNIGATNVLRTGNKVAAALTLLLDGGKGTAAVVIVAVMTDIPEAIAVAAVMSVIGHCFPISLGFRGGKGVATAIGVVLAMHPLSGIVMCAVWLATAALLRISSLAALCSCFAAPASLWLLLPPPYQMPFTIAGGLIALLSVSRHKANIARLIAGEEPRIGK
jgi:glycerol-3-phosphate acyltransferase PlsY